MLDSSDQSFLNSKLTQMSSISALFDIQSDCSNLVTGGICVEVLLVLIIFMLKRKIEVCMDSSNPVSGGI